MVGLSEVVDEDSELGRGYRRQKVEDWGLEEEFSVVVDEGSELIRRGRQMAEFQGSEEGHQQEVGGGLELGGKDIRKQETVDRASEGEGE